MVLGYLLRGLCGQVFENWYLLDLDRLSEVERLSIGIMIERSVGLGDAINRDDVPPGFVCGDFVWQTGICSRGSLPFGDRFGRFCFLIGRNGNKDKGRIGNGGGA